MIYKYNFDFRYYERIVKEVIITSNEQSPHYSN